MNSDHARWIAVAAVVAAATLPYLPSLDNDLVFDDRFLVGQDVRVTEPGHLGEIWLTDYWPGDRPSYNYRPITTTSFALAGRIPSQRWLNMALHATCSALVVMLCTSLGLGLLGAVSAGLLFAVHPLHSEAVYLIVGRGELLAALFGLGFLIGYLRRWHMAILVVLFGAALFSKESAIMLPVLALVLERGSRSAADQRRNRRRAFGLVAWCTIPVLALFALRYRVFGRFLTPPRHVNPLFNPLVELEGIWRPLNAVWIVVKYMLAMLWPVPLRADYSFDQLHLIRTLGDPGLLAGTVLICLLAAWYLRGRERGRWGAMIVFTALALLPVSNLLFTTGVGFGERLAYLPLLGLAMTAGLLTEHGRRPLGSRQRHRYSVGALGAAFVVICATLIVNRDGDWQTRDSFTAALVQNSPRSAFAHGVRGSYLLELGRESEAEVHIQTALEIRPTWPDAWATLAGIEFAAGNFSAAADYFVRTAEALEVSEFDREEISIFFYRAADLYLRAGDCSSARVQAARSRASISEIIPTQLIELERRIEQIGCE